MFFLFTHFDYIDIEADRAFSDGKAYLVPCKKSQSMLQKIVKSNAQSHNIRCAL